MNIQFAKNKKSRRRGKLPCLRNNMFRPVLQNKGQRGLLFCARDDHFIDHYGEERGIEVQTRFLRDESVHEQLL